jgi:CysZ protein
MINQISKIAAIFFQTLFSLKSEAIKFILFSGFLTLIIFSGVVWAAWSVSGWMAAKLAQLTPWDTSMESTLYSFMISLAIIVLFAMIIKYIILLLLSPILSYLSEKIEKSLRTDYIPGGFSMAASAARSVRINMRNFVKECFITVLLLIAGFIPGLNVISLPLLLLVQAYFAGFGIMDFYLERHKSFRETLVEVYDHKWAAITTGGIFLLLFAIPVLGAIIAPYLTTVTATKYFINNSKMV